LATFAELAQNANFGNFDPQTRHSFARKNTEAIPDLSKSAPLYTAAMSIKLPLDQMTTREKLAAMEALWEDLSRSPEAIESPEWHKEVLEERQRRLADGTHQFEDWERAKAKIREKLR
jgi:hypothetical protein